MHLYALIGLKSTLLNARIISRDTIFFTKRLLLPIMAPCIQPSAALIQHIRAKYVFKNTPQLCLKKEVTTEEKGLLVGSEELSGSQSDAKGAPMKSDEEGKDGGLELIPEDWVVVIGQRANGRQIEGQDELFAKLMNFLPRNRMKVSSEGEPLQFESILIMCGGGKYLDDLIIALEVSNSLLGTICV